MKIVLMVLLLFCQGVAWSQRDAFVEEEVFEAYINDSTPVAVSTRYGNDGIPHDYFSHVRTPVCKDGLCYLMVIDLYWDILGNFMKYELPGRHKLTKFDHIEFSGEDHSKLTGILSNRDSFLRFYSLENLIDPNEQRKSDVVDGVSAATDKSIQSEVVSGAVYSTYVLWHIVNGHIADSILSRTQALFDEKMMIHMLESDNYHYQYYALEKIGEKDGQRFTPHLIRLISDGSAYVPYFAIEKIDKKAWESPKNQRQLVGLLGKAGFEVQNELLNRLSGIPLEGDALNVLIDSLSGLKDSQIAKALLIIDSNKALVSEVSISKMRALAHHPNKDIANKTSSILDGLDKSVDKREQ